MREPGKGREAAMESFEDKLSIVPTLAICLHVDILGEDRSPERLERFLISSGTDFDDEFMDDGDAEENDSDDEERVGRRIREGW